MPLTSAELDRIRAELGVNTLDVGAEPYIGVHAVFEKVIQPYLREGSDTTTSTTVTAVPAGAIVSLTLVSTMGFAAHDQVVVDLDDLEEKVTVRGLVTGGISLILKKAHSGTYPVTVDGGLVIVRECLRRIRECKARIALLNPTAGPIKRVDEIEFHPPGNQTSIETAQQMLAMWRRELALALGLESILNQKRHSGGAICLY